MNIDKAPCLAVVSIADFALDVWNARCIQGRIVSVLRFKGFLEAKSKDFSLGLQGAWMVTCPSDIYNEAGILWIPANAEWFVIDPFLRKISGDPDAIDTTDDLEITNPKETIDA